MEVTVEATRGMKLLAWDAVMVLGGMSPRYSLGAGGCPTHAPRSTCRQGELDTVHRQDRMRASVCGHVEHHSWLPWPTSEG